MEGPLAWGMVIVLFGLVVAIFIVFLQKLANLKLRRQLEAEQLKTENRAAITRTFVDTLQAFAHEGISLTVSMSITYGLRLTGRVKQTESGAEVILNLTASNRGPDYQTAYLAIDFPYRYKTVRGLKGLQKALGELVQQRFRGVDKYSESTNLSPEVQASLPAHVKVIVEALRFYEATWQQVKADVAEKLQTVLARQDEYAVKHQVMEETEAELIASALKPFQKPPTNESAA